MIQNSTKQIIDTNVPVTANRVLHLDSIPDDELTCVLACVETIEAVVKNGGLVIDAEDEIFQEYRANLSMRGQPGVGDRFLKWVHDYRWGFPEGDRVSITKNGDSYNEFPEHAALKNFDISDRKFVAVAKTHAETPPILQATDSKWWGWKDALFEAGISVHFLCEELIKQKFTEKMGS